MRLISWLHISDIHMRASAVWSQDVVLKAMCEDISRQRKQGVSVDFILATGDLAFSGKAEEYKLAATFFDVVSEASGVPRERIFCIPGNHDIDRDCQKLCFLGARGYLESQNRVDLVLAPAQDLSTLLQRQAQYRAFQDAYFTGQERQWTADRLGYVSRVTIADVCFAIVGLDSAWLSEGGASDHGKLLIGERQAINALDLARALEPHVVIAMAHHPCHLLQDFDRRPVQSRIESYCQFFHCGHLHEPESRAAGFTGAGCLTLSAGASFETRESHNTYSVITLDLLRAQRTVQTVQYNPSTGRFSATSTVSYPIEITPAGTCRVDELAQAIRTYCASLSPWSHYFAALLLDQKAELLIIGQNGHAFGSLAVLLAQPDSELKYKTAEFMAFRNVLRVFYTRVPLPDLFARYGDPVAQYGATLERMCAAHAALKDRLADHEKDAETMAATEPQDAFSHTAAMLADLAAAKEWVLLREQAERHIEAPNATVAILAQRMLALSLANSDEAADKVQAIKMYRAITAGDFAEAIDAGNLAILLMGDGNHDEAKAAVLAGIGRFPLDRVDYFVQVGQKIVETTGDRDFRKRMEAAIEERGQSDRRT
jgi:hypothetical protein